MSVHGLNGASYVDKVLGAITFTESSDTLKFTSETDRVYTTLTKPDGSAVPIIVIEGDAPKLIVTRDSLPNTTVWNPWIDKAAAMGDFAPKDGWKNMICIEPGAVTSWTKLEAGEVWEGSQVITAL